MIFSKIFSKILRSKATTLSRTILPLFSAGLLVGILTSCTTTKTIPLETLRHDTIYINKQSYDSIHIDNTHLIDRGGDTVYIKDKQIEYRFRLLRDTIRIAKVDSIPYEVKIIETIEVRKPPNLFDYLCYLSFGILIGITGWELIKFVPSRH